MTLACGDAYSKFENVTLAGVGDEDCVGNSLLQIWNLRYGQKILTFVQTLSTLVRILKLKFRLNFEAEVGQYFAADVWLRLQS